MEKTDWQKLKQDAAETIQNIDTDKFTKDAYVLFGASLAILDHVESGGINMPTPQEKSMKAANSFSVSKSLHELVEDELSDAEMYYAMGEREVAMDELRHADKFLSVSKAHAITGSDTAYINEMTQRRNQIAMKF